MKTLLSFITLLLISNFTYAQTTAIPDANFEQKLISLGYDTRSPDGVVLTNNTNAVTYLAVNSSNISDLTGIEDFTVLETFHCASNQITSLDVTQNTALVWLRCYDNQLTSLNVTQNTASTELYCYGNQITRLDVTQNMALTSLVCFNNQLQCLNLKNGNNTSIFQFLFGQNPNLTCIEVDDDVWATHRVVILLSVLLFV